MNNFREITVSAKNGRLDAYKGALYDKKEKKLLLFPGRASSCEIPAYVKNVDLLINRANIDAQYCQLATYEEVAPNLERIKVKKGNRYFKSKEGVEEFFLEAGYATVGQYCSMNGMSDLNLEDVFLPSTLTGIYLDYADESRYAAGIKESTVFHAYDVNGYTTKYYSEIPPTKIFKSLKRHIVGKGFVFKSRGEVLQKVKKVSYELNGDTANIHWSKSKDADGYMIYRSTIHKVPYPSDVPKDHFNAKDKIKTIKARKTVSAVIKKSKKKRHYYIVAYKNVGKKRICGKKQEIGYF